jgi:4-amino-4-deoxy-L-arabinose transferase-like glycosyltransferase
MKNSHSTDLPGPPARLSLENILLIFVPAFLLFVFGAMTDMTVPGVYMDAINPDYLVVRLLNPAPADMTLWFPPGTALFGRFPIIGQIYHGALPYYIGLPFYALFGTGIIGIRLTNMVYGLLVISGAGLFMWAFGTRVLICSLCLALLALDPGFLFSFRTQFYITLLPVAALLASAALIEARRQAPTRRVAGLAGLLAGLSCYGYFIYGFLVPAIAVLAFCRWRRMAAAKSLMHCWVGGFVLGVLPYALGLLVVFVSTGGLRPFYWYLMSTLHHLDVQKSAFSVGQRLGYFVALVHGTILDTGPAEMMLGKAVALEMPVLKTLVLLVVPVAAILPGLGALSRRAGLLTIAGMVLGFLVLVLGFGDRLWFHHAALLLPVLYAALALALERFAWLFAALGPRRVGLAAALVAAPFLIANAADRQAVFVQLRITGGVGLSSDAIDRFAEDSLRETTPVYAFFPDWGVFMPFAMLTHGSIPYTTVFTQARARERLCTGQDAEVVTVVGQPENRVPERIATVGWPRPEVTQYDQRDGTPVLHVVRWRAANRAPDSCP